MKIAVLGANGFVGSSIVGNLSNKHEVVPVSRETLNLLDTVKVVKFLKTNKFDVVVNAAATMTDPNGIKDTWNNLGMFMNFYNNSDLFGKFINMASGAEYDRSRDICKAKELEIFDRIPTDSYGFGQNLKSRLCYDRNNFFTIRIFNCFGQGEISTRVFPRFLSKGNQKLQITDDRFFDYFSVQDLLKIVNHCIDNTWTVKDVNAVYKEKFKISQVLSMFCELNNISPDFEIVSHGTNNYTGDNNNLASLEIKLNGMKHGLLTYIKEINNVHY